MTAIEQSISAGINSGTPLTLPSWTPLANELVLVAVAQRHETIVPTIAGNGLTWVKLADVDNPQAKCGIVVWRAMGASPTTGSIVITMTGNILPASAVAIRLSGVNTEGSNGSGAVEALYTNRGSSRDTNDMKISITTLTSGAWALALGAHMRKSLTVPAGETEIDINNKGGTGSDYIYCSAWYEVTASPITVTVGDNNDLSGDCDWAVVGLSINGVPTSADISPSPVVAASTVVSPSIITGGTKVFELSPATAAVETISPVVIVPVPTVPMFILAPSYEVWICDPLGNRLAFVDNLISLSAVRVVDNVGSVTLQLPGDFDQDLLQLDGMIEIWRSPYTAGSLRLETVGFMRYFSFEENSEGIQSITVGGPDQVDLLERRIVAYAASSSQARKTDVLDDMMKAIVRENLGSLSTDTSRNLSALNFSVEGDRTLGPSSTRAFSWKNVLQTLQELSELSIELENPIYFDVVPVIISPTRIGFQFRTYQNQRGVDRTLADDPLLFGVESGGLLEPSLSYDYRAEANYIYSGGQGSGSDRTVVEASDTARIGASPWNRRESFADARNENSEAGVTAVSQGKLEEAKPFVRFAGTLKDTPHLRFGLDWDLGDLIPVSHMGRQFNVQVTAVKFEINAEGDKTIESKFEVVF